MVPEYAASLHLPLLIVHGTADQVTSCEESEAFIQAAGSKDKKISLYEGAYHELHNELPHWKIPLYKEYIDWIKKRAASASEQ